MRILEEFWYGNIEPMEYVQIPAHLTTHSAKN